MELTLSLQSVIYEFGYWFSLLFSIQNTPPLTHKLSKRVKGRIEKNIIEFGFED